MDVAIGSKLRAARQSAGLSQRALAKRAGVSNAMISLMESGRANPSIGNLKRVLDGIPMSLAAFFAFEDEETAPKVFYPASELGEIGKGAISYREVAANQRNKAVQILHERLDVGADTGKIPLSHEAEEGGIIIAGRMELTVGDQKRVLEKGDAYYFDSRQPHRFRTIGDEPCEVISACSPPSF